MWNFGVEGFTSTIAYKRQWDRTGLGDRVADADEGQLLLVRCRLREDMERFVARLNVEKEHRFSDEEIKYAVTENGDYRFRTVITRLEFGWYMGQSIGRIKYDNFKSEATRVSGHAYHDMLMGIWSKTRREQTSQADKEHGRDRKASGLPARYDGKASDRDSGLYGQRQLPMPQTDPDKSPWKKERDRTDRPAQVIGQAGDDRFQSDEYDTTLLRMARQGATMAQELEGRWIYDRSSMVDFDPRLGRVLTAEESKKLREDGMIWATIRMPRPGKIEKFESQGANHRVWVFWPLSNQHRWIGVDSIKGPRRRWSTGGYVLANKDEGERADKVFAAVKDHRYRINETTKRLYIEADEGEEVKAG